MWLQTWSSIVTVLLAMVLFPEPFKRAQEEVDAVTGLNRLPDLSDRSSLPFLECVHQEVFRYIDHASRNSSLVDRSAGGTLLHPLVSRVTRSEWRY